MKDNRKEKDIKKDIVGLLYKSKSIIKSNNGIYLFTLCIVTMLVCMYTEVTWLLVLIALIIYWLYIAIAIVVFFYYHRQLKKLYSELNEKIGEVESTFEMPAKGSEALKYVFRADIVTIIATSLVAMYLYY